MLHPLTARRYVVTPGFTSAESTVVEIGKLIRQGKADPLIRSWALRILAGEGVDGRDDEGVAATLFHWVQRTMPYRRDVHAVEALSDPRALLRSIEAGAPGGDCDDFDILVGSLLESVGIPVRIVTTSLDGRQWHHTYLDAYLRGRGWTPIDGAKDTAPIGWEHSGAMRRRVYDLSGRVLEDQATDAPEGLSGCCGQRGRSPLGDFFIDRGDQL